MNLYSRGPKRSYRKVHLNPREERTLKQLELCNLVKWTLSQGIAPSLEELRQRLNDGSFCH